ncbi:hypothetical protein [Desulfosporosinus sp.]|uniref:hypothetical protein n=1 Tax=Desulfosporosinus sp. TaxID=157907 RepID=UPI0026149A41|nr:hypothetical protein [Desulfosporosinus sp.]
MECKILPGALSVFTPNRFLRYVRLISSLSIAQPFNCMVSGPRISVFTSKKPSLPLRTLQVGRNIMEM